MIDKVSGSYAAAPSSSDVPVLARRFHDHIKDLISSMSAQDVHSVAKAVRALEPLCQEADRC